jgi:ATP-dependent RNA helicase RhlE
MTNFTELSLSSALQSNLKRHLFNTPTPIQAQAIPPALAGSDVVATAQTGTGKTLAFLLPLIESLTREPGVKGVRAVVLSPTRELALQIRDVFTVLSAGTGLRATAVVGGLNESAQLQAISKGAQVLIATPGRLCDFLNRKLVRLGSVSVLVLDEGDRMLDMGFLPAIQMILDAMPAERQTMFFSATIEAAVAKLINSYLKDPVRVSIGVATKPAEHVDLHVYEVDQDRKLGLLQYMLKTELGSFLVFARTKHGVDRLAKKLAGGGVRAARIHGDRTQGQRNQALRGFQAGDYRVLVATDVAARGIHVEGISHVVNYDLPQAPEDFIHRVGRTGRAGARGTASTFGTPHERGGIRAIERALRIQFNRRPVAAEVGVEPRQAAPAHEAVPARHAARPAARRTFSFGANRRGGARQYS